MPSVRNYIKVRKRGLHCRALTVRFPAASCEHRAGVGRFLPVDSISTNTITPCAVGVGAEDWVRMSNAGAAFEHRESKQFHTPQLSRLGGIGNLPFTAPGFDLNERWRNAGCNECYRTRLMLSGLCVQF
jgi:hypothetical protein